MDQIVHKNFKFSRFNNSQTLFDETINANLLPFHQRFLENIDYERATEGLLQELQTLGYRMSAKKATLHIRGCPP